MITLAVLATFAHANFHGGAALVSSEAAVRPGQTFDAAIRITMDPGWHTYWKNPGDAGIPPKVTWRLPAGWNASEFRWPVPKKLISPDVVSYGYEHQVLLLTRITAPPTAPVGRLALKARVDWLVCREGCIPARSDVTLPLQVSRRPERNSVWAAKIEKAIRSLPSPAPSQSLEAFGSGKSITLSIDRENPGKAPQIYFFPAEPTIDPSAAQPMEAVGRQIRLHLSVSPFASTPAKRLKGLLFTVKGASIQAQTLDIPIRRSTS